ncbi:EthD family reductase [Roseibium sp. SCP14]|uniref:EthD family reductase n=1 Tax=Roseibium sp. SCP14 TaxID=3141375 RepID=UPI0033359004
MSISLQVLYPIKPDTTFDQDYYKGTHMKLVRDHLGAFMVSAQASKGLAGGPDAPPAFYAIATMTFENQEKFDQAMAAAGPVLADIPNYTNTKPQMLIGEVLD